MSKIILITGSSTGIGALAANDLAQNNQLIIHYRSSKEEAEITARTVKQRGGIPFLFQADLATDEGCIILAKFIEDNFNKLDVLVNNAGGLGSRHSASEITWSLLEKIFALNTFSVMRLSSLCTALLQKSNSPCIVNITSLAMRTGAPSATVYGAAKAAIDAFTRGFAKELAPKIRVNAIAPGFIKTPFHQGKTTEEQLNNMADLAALKKLGEPSHISMAIKFLIENEFMTGETIDINGGLHMR